MIKELWQKILERRQLNPKESLSQSGEVMGVSKSVIKYHEDRHKKRKASSGTDQWDTAWGQNYLKRMIVSTIYTFGIKGGVGAARISEHFKHLQLGEVAAISESSIYRLTHEIMSNIEWYKELQQAGLKSEAASTLVELEVVLGLDETWLEEMLLVCQDLTSGYLFLNKPVQTGQP